MRQTQHNPCHCWQVVTQNGVSIGHKSLIFVSKVYAACGLYILTNPDLLKKIQNEGTELLAERTYKSPLPADLKPSPPDETVAASLFF